MRSRVELFEAIRRDRRLEELSIRELADRHRMHRRTVRQALDDAVPPPRKAYPPRPRPAIDPWATVIDGWLMRTRTRRASSGTPPGGCGSAWSTSTRPRCEVTVSRYVARRRVERGLGTREVTVPQTHPAGEEAEVDFGEFYATSLGWS